MLSIKSPRTRKRCDNYDPPRITLSPNGDRYSVTVYFSRRDYLIWNCCDLTDAIQQQRHLQETWGARR
jgi:hypothetical protein